MWKIKPMENFSAGSKSLQLSSLLSLIQSLSCFIKADTDPVYKAFWVSTWRLYNIHCPHRQSGITEKLTLCHTAPWTPSDPLCEREMERGRERYKGREREKEKGRTRKQDRGNMCLRERKRDGEMFFMCLSERDHERGIVLCLRREKQRERESERECFLFSQTSVLCVV